MKQNVEDELTLMEWIKTAERLPSLGTRVLVFGDGFTCIANLSDINEYDRSRARTRKDKYPIELKWQADSNCCYSPDENEEQYPYWSPLPKEPE